MPRAWLPGGLSIIGSCFFFFLQLDRLLLSSDTARQPGIRYVSFPQWLQSSWGGCEAEGRERLRNLAWVQTFGSAPLHRSWLASGLTSWHEGGFSWKSDYPMSAVGGLTISQSALTLLSICCQAVRRNQAGLITMMATAIDKRDAIEAVINGTMLRHVFYTSANIVACF